MLKAGVFFSTRVPENLKELLQNIQEVELAGIYSDNPDLTKTNATELHCKPFLSPDFLVDYADVILFMDFHTTYYDSILQASKISTPMFFNAPVFEDLQKFKQFQEIVNESHCNTEIHLPNINHSVISAFRNLVPSPILVEIKKGIQMDDNEMMKTQLMEVLYLLIQLFKSEIKKVRTISLPVRNIGYADIIYNHIEFFNGGLATVKFNSLSENRFKGILSQPGKFLRFNVPKKQFTIYSQENMQSMKIEFEPVTLSDSIKSFLSHVNNGIYINDTEDFSSLVLATRQIFNNLRNLKLL